MMTVSVILPIYNGERFVQAAVESVLAQTWASFELLLIDDGSAEPCRPLLEPYLQDDRLRYVYQANAGVSAARNRGLELSRGDLIAFIDQDDRWRPQTLQTHVDYHAMHPETGYTLAHQICFLEGGSDVPAWFRLQQLDTPHVGYLPGTLMVKRPVFDQLGLFDTAYPISSDADWFARAKDAAVPTHTLPDVLLERRIHEANQSRHSGQIQAELFQLLQASIRRKQEATE